MARMDLRARAFAWLTRRQGAVGGMTDEQVISLQKHEMPDSKVTNWTLRAAGVPVRLTDYLGMPHGFLNFPRLCRSAPQALAELIAEQKLALAPAGQSVP